jgi:hypothetical protein
MSEPVAAAPLKKMLLGDKPWFKSLTTWGVIVFIAAEAGITEACAGGALGTGLCATLATGLKYIGGALAVFGLRRAAVSPNVA